MYPESELLQLSGLQHLVFCERQWALIHLEQQWTENVFTTEGRIMHDKSDSADSEIRDDVLTVRSLRIRSLKLGLVGRMDVLEFYRSKDNEVDKNSHLENGGLPESIRLADREGLWKPVPVEYKRGKPKVGRCDEVQLCAQVLCLEEMLSVYIPHGFLFYGKRKRRTKVDIDDELRDLTVMYSKKMHRMFQEGRTPAGRHEDKCKSCSLFNVCHPEIISGRKKVAEYMAHAFRDTEEIESEIRDLDADL